MAEVAISKGAPLHGNYHGYYTKRVFARDPRLALIPKDTFKNARVLDVGCNEGVVTCEVAQLFHAREVIGVDIDDSLVRAAWKRRRTAWSQWRPPPPASSGSDSRPSKRPKLAKEEDGTAELDGINTYPSAFEHMFGPLPIPPSTSQTKSVFPHNISFRTADWVNKGIVEDTKLYDVVLAFSVSKWIHLNDGDAGIVHFFSRAYDTLKPGDVFILEPQEIESYAKAKRMDPKLKEVAKSLTLKPSPDFERILVELGFERPERLGSTGKGGEWTCELLDLYQIRVQGFHRPVDMYRKPSTL